MMYADNYEDKKDIFDRIMELPILRLFEPLYKKYKEVLLYVFFGVVTTVISIGSYAFLAVLIGMNVLVANVISWILAVTVAFLTNRVWVFHQPTSTMKEFFAQMTSFFTGRIMTLVIEEAILFIFISMLHYNSMIVKIAAQIVVFVLNYVISKWIVFHEKDNA